MVVPPLPGYDPAAYDESDTGSVDLPVLSVALVSAEQIPACGVSQAFLLSSYSAPHPTGGQLFLRSLPTTGAQCPSHIQTFVFTLTQPVHSKHVSRASPPPPPPAPASASAPAPPTRTLSFPVLTRDATTNRPERRRRPQCRLRSITWSVTVSRTLGRVSWARTGWRNRIWRVRVRVRVSQFGRSEGCWRIERCLLGMGGVRVLFLRCGFDWLVG